MKNKYPLLRRADNGDLMKSVWSTFDRTAIAHPRLRRIAATLTLLLLIAVARFQFSARRHIESSRTPATDDFFPLHPGSTWTYRVVEKDQNHSEILTDRVIDKKKPDASRFVGEVVSEYLGNDISHTSTTSYAVEDGYLTRRTLDTTSSPLLSEPKFLPRLLRPGVSWSNTLFPFDRSPQGFRIAQSHETFFEIGEVIVPAGHFAGCIRIETKAAYLSGPSSAHELRRLVYEDWYAPNVGLIKTVVLKRSFFRHEIARLELIGFATGRSSSLPAGGARRQITAKSW